LRIGKKTVKIDDTVVLVGDTSWGTYLKDCIADFQYLNKLNGRKIILKGNHDYWWTTQSKFSIFLSENSFSNIIILQNNTIVHEDTALCGTRGWLCPGDDAFSEEDAKIYKRELIRFRLSLESAARLSPKSIFAFLHYPPINSKKQIDNGFLELLKEFKVEKCIYGHLHSRAHNFAVTGSTHGIDFGLVSSDYIDFMPQKLLN